MKLIGTLLLLAGMALAVGALAGGCDDSPADVGQPCAKRSDCAEMCRPICDPAPCTADSTAFTGECSEHVGCSWEIAESGALEPTPCT